MANRPLMLLLVITAVIRAAVLIGGADQLRDDPDAYHALATSLVTTGTLGIISPTDPEAIPSASAFRPPLYPTLLASLYRSIIATATILQEPSTLTINDVARPAVALLHWLIGMITVWLTYLTGYRWLAPRAGGVGGEQRRQTARLVAFTAGMLVAIDPLLLQASVRVMTESLAACLAIAELAIATRWGTALSGTAAIAGEQQDSSRNATGGHRPSNIRWWSAALGTVLGLAFLCRPTFVVWTAGLVAYAIALAAVGTFWPAARRAGRLPSRRSCLLASAWITLTSSLFVMSWTARNQSQFGQPIWATTHGGYTLLLGNNPSFYQYMRSGLGVGIAWDPQPFFDRWELRHQADPRQASFWDDKTPAADLDWQRQYRLIHRQPQQAECFEDQLASEAAKAAIARDPVGFAVASLWRIWRLYSPMPQVFEPAPDRLPIGIGLVTAYYCFVSLLALWGVGLLGRRLWHPSLVAVPILLLSLTAVHSVYWSNMRMRAPAVPAISLLAAMPLLSYRRSQH